jgi:eukaryotic-like serine/threonine-protein kinase
MNRSFKNFISFVFSRQAMAHLSAMAVLLVVVIIATTTMLRIYTSHGYKMPVPDFTGQKLEKAIELANARNLNIVVLDSVYNTEIEPGAIITHTPGPGFNVKENRSVFVTTNALFPEMLSMPDLLNTSLRQAREILHVHGLELGRVSYAPDFAKNYVLAQNRKGMPIPKGSRIERGSKIDLTLGMGSSNKEVLVPDLAGMNYTDAVNKIAASSLTLGAAVFPAHILSEQDSSNARVARQSPKWDEGKFAKAGSLIDIWMDDENLEEDTFD